MEQWWLIFRKEEKTGQLLKNTNSLAPPWVFASLVWDVAWAMAFFCSSPMRLWSTNQPLTASLHRLFKDNGTFPGWTAIIHRRTLTRRSTKSTFSCYQINYFSFLFVNLNVCTLQGYPWNLVFLLCIRNPGLF